MLHYCCKNIQQGSDRGRNDIRSQMQPYYVRRNKKKNLKGYFWVEGKLHNLTKHLWWLSPFKWSHKMQNSNFNKTKYIWGGTCCKTFQGDHSSVKNNFCFIRNWILIIFLRILNFLMHCKSYNFFASI